MPDDDVIPAAQRQEIIVKVQATKFTGPRASSALHFVQPVTLDFVQPVTLDFVKPISLQLNAALQPGLSAMASQLAQSVQPLLQEYAANFGRRIAALNSVEGILGRQQETMTGIGNSVRVPTPEELQRAEEALLGFIPEAEEDGAVVEQAAAQLTADARQQTMVERLTGGLRRSEVAGLTRWALLVLVWWLLSQYAQQPGQGVTNQLAVLAIVVAMANVIIAKG